MEKKKTEAIDVYLRRDFYNSLITALESFVKADIGNYYGDNALRLKNKIEKHGRIFKNKDEDNVAIRFYPQEATMMIKMLTIYVSIFENPTNDFFESLKAARMKK